MDSGPGSVRRRAPFLLALAAASVLVGACSASISPGTSAVGSPSLAPSGPSGSASATAATASATPSVPGSASPAPSPPGSPAMSAMPFSLSSSAFAAGAAIPRRYTCDGPDVSPPLAWAGAPTGTAAFLLVVDDPDANGFVHWVVADLPAATSSVAEGASGHLGPAVEGRNGFGRIGWGGP